LPITPWHFLFVAFVDMSLVIGSGRYRRFVQLKPLRLLGEVSYGLYLYHLLILALFDRIVGLSGISVATPHLPCSWVAF
jgi:peptidoglycan/LPS O-acetylase OafA/YrhL